MVIMSKMIMLVFLLVYLQISFAETQPACPPETLKPSPELIKTGMMHAQDHGFLWRITKDGRSSFLYGTVHIAKFEWMFPGPSLRQALNASDTMALELDMTDKDIMQRLMLGMRQQSSVELPVVLQERMRKQAQAVCVPYDGLAKLIPVMQVMTLGLTAARWDDLHSGYAIDMFLAGYGRGAKKRIVSLETPELQTQMLQGTNPEETVKMVADGLDEFESGRDRSMMLRLTNAWANSDYAELENFADWCECMNTDVERDMMKHTLDDRNPGLAESIDNLHSSGKQVFAAVGSLHMFGETGLPTLLEGRGYQVEQISLKPL